MIWMSDVGDARVFLDGNEWFGVVGYDLERCEVMYVDYDDEPPNTIHGKVLEVRFDSPVNAGQAMCRNAPPAQS